METLSFSGFLTVIIEKVMNTLLSEEIFVRVFQNKVVTRKIKRPYISSGYIRTFLLG